VAVVGFTLCARASEPVCSKLCEDCAGDGVAVTGALAEAGRLLPAGGGEITDQWNVRYPDGSVSAAGKALGGLTRTAAEETAALYPVLRLVRREVRTWSDGSQRTGPWIEVPDE
jgi:hypothetical protein